MTYFNIKKFRTFLFFFYFFDIFVVDFKIFVKLSSIFFIFILSATLSSLGPNLYFFKILIFRGDIPKMCTKRYPRFQLQFFPCIPSSQILNLKKNYTQILSSLQQMQLEGYAIAQSIDNFLRIIFTTYIQNILVKNDVYIQGPPKFQSNFV